MAERPSLHSLDGDVAGDSGAGLKCLADRFVPGKAEVLMLTKDGLRERAWKMEVGQAPREFTYGFLGLISDGIDARMISTSAAYPGLAGTAARWCERGIARLTGISMRGRFLDEIRDVWPGAKLVVSITDHFSYTLGRYFRRFRERPVTIGLFQGFSDFDKHLTWLGRRLSRKYVELSLQGLDHLIFLSQSDKEAAIRRFSLDPDRTSILLFGVDHNFWTPGEVRGGHGILAVGSDPNRDYATLLAARCGRLLTIVSQLPLRVPSSRPDVRIVRGSYAAAALSDEQLREAYRAADVVVVPLNDVFQPSGQSVTLQAMACGRPVILTKTRGLWAPDLLIHGKNCILVPPGDSVALGNAIEAVLTDSLAARRIGEEARRTVERLFTIAHMEASLLQIVKSALISSTRS